MKLQELLKGTFTIAAVVEGNDGPVCPVTEFLDKLPPQYQSSAAGIINLIEHIAKSGFKDISSKQCHSIDKNNKIYELIKGDLRLFFFKGHQDVIVIATHAIIKKTQKTTKQDKERAIKLKRQYQKHHDQNNIIWLESTE